MLVRSGVRNASMISVLFDAGIMTAGVVASFVIKSFDTFGNRAQSTGLDAGSTLFFLRAAEPQSARLLANISTVGKTNIEVALVTTTRAVVTKAHSLFVYPGGLLAEYTLSDIPFPQTGIPEIHWKSCHEISNPPSVCAGQDLSVHLWWEPTPFLQLRLKLMTE